uniref:Uncharacterized protein n=1 Tax=Pipistrellus kuhlii TaxID=59472 RepID=A0A7J7W3L0_PIPKU|nr:hypothetical protein mPipKuh1_008139 [Pipistrellus kuhlii]
MGSLRRHTPWSVAGAARGTERTGSSGPSSVCRSGSKCRVPETACGHVAVSWRPPPLRHLSIPSTGHCCLSPPAPPLQSHRRVNSLGKSQIFLCALGFVCGCFFFLLIKAPWGPCFVHSTALGSGLPDDSLFNSLKM